MVKKTVLQTYSFREGLRDGLPIALGYLTVAFGFGLTAVQAGLYPLTALILSLINETSAGQTAGLSVIAAHGTLIEMALTQFIINLRYSLMAISLSQRVDASFTVPARLFLGFSITDEIFAVASTKHDPVGTRYFSGIALLPYFAWAAGTLIGALAGAFLAPFLFGLYWKRASKAACWVSFFFSTIVMIANIFLRASFPALLRSPINAGAFCMIAGLILVPVVSLLTPAPDKKLVDDAFSCYERKVLVTQRQALGESK